MGAGVCIRRLGPRVPAVHRGGISVFDYVEVTYSSPGLFICSGYLRADVIRAQCSGRSGVAPGVLRSVFTLFLMKDSSKNACWAPTNGTHYPVLCLSLLSMPALLCLPTDTLHNVLHCFKPLKDVFFLFL